MTLMWKDTFKTDIDKQDLEALPEDVHDLFTILQNLPEGDKRKLLALNPFSNRELLDCGTVMTSDLFHVAEDLIMLKRLVFLKYPMFDFAIA